MPSSQKEPNETGFIYVDALASVETYPPGDAWISLTDAARVTRTSEAMVRRWARGGRLPVKREPAGIPPRTRLVRLSDVARIRPIVDPTAAITGDTRKLDLPSIPRQQQEIVEQHHLLLEQIQSAQQTLQAFRQILEMLEDQVGTQGRLHTQQIDEISQQIDERVDALANVQEALHVAQREQAATHQRDLKALQDHLTERSETLTKTQEALREAQKEQESTSQRTQAELHSMLGEVQQEIKKLRGDLTKQAQEERKLVNDLRQEAKALTEQQGTVHKQEMNVLLKQLEAVQQARQVLEQQLASEISARKRHDVAIQNQQDEQKKQIELLLKKL